MARGNLDAAPTPVECFGGTRANSTTPRCHGILFLNSRPPNYCVGLVLPLGFIAPSNVSTIEMRDIFGVEIAANHISHESLHMFGGIDLGQPTLLDDLSAWDSRNIRELLYLKNSST